MPRTEAAGAAFTDQLVVGFVLPVDGWHAAR